MPHSLLTTLPRLVPLRTLPFARTTNQAEDDDPNDVFALARTIGVFSPTWLRTGCVYGPQPGNAYSILVMPVPPNSTKRHNAYHVASTPVAPSLALYSAYRSGALTWHDFALRYLAELEAHRHGVLSQFVEHLCSIPARYAGVLLLGFRQAPGGNEARVRCARRLLYAWLLDEVGRLPEFKRPLLRPPAQPRRRLQAC
jgi:uncharacterized protein YeaO (DUF488 family)